MTSRIICVGNRFVQGDDLGPRVFDRLAEKPLPGHIELIDGGIRGLDLLQYVEGSEKVIFVDSVSGFGNPGDIVVMDGIQAGSETAPSYGHSEGLSYLLKVLPRLCGDQMPRIMLVGVEGDAGEETVAHLADRCLELAT